MTVSYRRTKDGFWSGSTGAVTKLGTIPKELRCGYDIRVPLVGDVYLCVGYDGNVCLYNYGPAKIYELGFGACVTYAVPAQ